MNLNKEYLGSIIKEKRKGAIIIVIVLAVIAIATYFGIKDTLGFEEFTDKSDELDLEIYSNKTEEIEDAEEKIKVYVTGEVVNPGVIEINLGDRIEDAIKSCRGDNFRCKLRKSQSSI